MFRNFPRSIKFIIIGGGNTVFGLLIFSLLYKSSGLIVPSQIIAHFIAVAQGFVTYKMFVFEDTTLSNMNAFLRFNISYLWLLLFNLLCGFIALKLNFNHPIITQGISLFLGAFLSYVIHKYFSFAVKGK